MNNKLADLWKRIEDNKKNNQFHCKSCPLQHNYDGPVYFDYEGEGNPKIMIISESPAGYNNKEVRCDFTKLKKWKEIILTEENRQNAELSDYTLGKFLPYITNNGILSSLKGIASENFYWTHTVKCFIQKGNETLEAAKNRITTPVFKKACTICGMYIKQEFDMIQPSLTIILSQNAWGNFKRAVDNIPYGSGNFRKAFEIILSGECIKVTDTQDVIALYHPSYLARLKKMRSYKELIPKIEKSYKNVRSILADRK